MQLTEQMIEKVVADILAKATSGAALQSDPALVPVGVSNRHIHLSREDMEMLFGPGQYLTRMKAMKQPGQYAAEETVTLKGPQRRATARSGSWAISQANTGRDLRIRRLCAGHQGPDAHVR